MDVHKWTYWNETEYLALPDYSRGRATRNFRNPVPRPRVTVQQKG